MYSGVPRQAQLTDLFEINQMFDQMALEAQQKSLRGTDQYSLLQKTPQQPV